MGFQQDADDTFQNAEYQGNPVTEDSKDVDGNEFNSKKEEEQETEETPSSTEAAPGANDQAKEAAKEAHDYEKSYKHLQSKYTKDSQRLKQIEREYEQAKSRIEILDRLESALQGNPRAVEALKVALQHNGLQPEIAENEVYKAIAPQMQKIQEMDQYIQGLKAEQIKTQANNTLTKAETEADSFFKEAFGRDMTNAEKIQVLEWMQEQGVYNGRLAARDIFFDQALSAREQKALEAQKVKKGLGVTRSTTMNSAQAKAPQKDSMSFREAWQAAKEELGLEA